MKIQNNGPKTNLSLGIFFVGWWFGLYSATNEMWLGLIFYAFFALIVHFYHIVGMNKLKEVLFIIVFSIWGLVQDYAFFRFGIVQYQLTKSFPLWLIIYKWLIFSCYIFCGFGRFKNKVKLIAFLASILGVVFYILESAIGLTNVEVINLKEMLVIGIMNSVLTFYAVKISLKIHKV